MSNRRDLHQRRFQTIAFIFCFTKHKRMKHFQYRGIVRTLANKKMLSAVLSIPFLVVTLLVMEYDFGNQNYITADYRML